MPPSPSKTQAKKDKKEVEKKLEAKRKLEVQKKKSESKCQEKTSSQQRIHALALHPLGQTNRGLRWYNR